ncbi:MAG: pyruvate kinase alpha/beta domain-containing protein [Kosmotogaceae bacterium]
MYFKENGEKNTESVLEIVFNKAKENGIDTIVLASTRGIVAKNALNMVPEELKLVIVTHSIGFRETGDDEFDNNVRKNYKNTRHEVLTTTHLFRGIDGYFYKSKQGVYPPQVFAEALRLFGEGTKVAVEIAIMAADAGLVPVDEWIISAGGTGKGLDTAYILQACNSSDLSNFKFGELLAIPSEFAGQ